MREGDPEHGTGGILLQQLVSHRLRQRAQRVRHGAHLGGLVQGAGHAEDTGGLDQVARRRAAPRQLRRDQPLVSARGGQDGVAVEDVRGKLL